MVTANGGSLNILMQFQTYCLALLSSLWDVKNFSLVSKIENKQSLVQILGKPYG